MSQSQVVPFRQQVESFGAALEKMKGQLAQALPSHIKPDKLLRVALLEVQKNPKLLECTRNSLFGSILTAAQLGLEPGGPLGHAYLVPYRDREKGLVCQLIPGYKGLVMLAYQSGAVASIRARVVREKDRFEYEYGAHERLVHVPDRSPNPGVPVAVYAVATMKGIDDPQFVVLEAWEVELIRARSKSANSGPWVTDPEEMAKKSAIRRLAKLLPASADRDLARAIALDEAAEAPDMTQAFGAFVDAPVSKIMDEASPESEAPPVAPSVSEEPPGETPAEVPAPHVEPSQNGRRMSLKTGARKEREPGEDG